MPNSLTPRQLNLILRAPEMNDEEKFLDVMNRSRSLHSPFAMTYEDWEATHHAVS